MLSKYFGLPFASGLLMCACLVLQARTGQGSSSGLRSLEGSTPTVRIVTRPSVEASHSSAWKGTRVLGCTTSGPRCFEPASGPIRGLFLNVGSFFDRPRMPPGRGQPYEPRTSSSQFFVKLFESPTPDASYQIEGLGFQALVTPVNLMVTFASAGVVLTDAANPYFPSADALQNLQQVEIAPAPSDQETCVDLSDENVVLAPGQAAWLVLRFPDVADSVFVGVFSDTTGTDHACDFMTRDTGDLYYRPDPAASPTLDWGIGVYGQAVTRKSEVPWSEVKRTYR